MMTVMHTLSTESAVTLSCWDLFPQLCIDDEFLYRTSSLFHHCVVLCYINNSSGTVIHGWVLSLQTLSWQCYGTAVLRNAELAPEGRFGVFCSITTYSGNPLQSFSCRLTYPVCTVVAVSQGVPWHLTGQCYRLANIYEHGSGLGQINAVNTYIK